MINWYAFLIAIGLALLGGSFWLGNAPANNRSYGRGVFMLAASIICFIIAAVLVVVNKGALA